MLCLSVIATACFLLAMHVGNASPLYRLLLAVAIPIHLALTIVWARRAWRTRQHLPRLTGRRNRP